MTNSKQFVPKYFVKDAWGQWYACSEYPEITDDSWQAGEMVQCDPPRGINPDIYWQDSRIENHIPPISQGRF